MQKWLTAFFLLVVMTGGALAGVPMHSGEKECHMSGMMDCCAKAQMKSDQPEVRAAQLCCSLNCTEPGTTQPSGSFKISPQLAVTLNSFVDPQSSYFTCLVPAPSFSSFGYQQNSSPAYILHLALLI